MIDDAAEAILGRAQLILCPLALRDVASHAQKAMSALLKLANSNLDREGGAVFASMESLESDHLLGHDALLEARNGCIVETDVEIVAIFADQFFPAIAQTIAGSPVDVEHGRFIVKQKEGVSCVIHKGAE